MDLDDSFPPTQQQQSQSQSQSAPGGGLSFTMDPTNNKNDADSMDTTTTTSTSTSTTTNNSDASNTHNTKDNALLVSKLMAETIKYGQELKSEFANDSRREIKKALEDTFALIAYPDARMSSLAPLLEESGRVPVAEELNGAILGECYPPLSLSNSFLPRVMLWSFWVFGCGLMM